MGWMTLVGAGVSAVGHMAQAGEQARGHKLQEQQLRIQERTTRTAADQAEAERRKNLVDSLQAIAAIRAGRGVGMTSPTGMAFLQSEIDTAQSDIVTERTNYLARADSFRLAAGEARRGARFSLLKGAVGAAGALGEGVHQYNLLSTGGASLRQIRKGGLDPTAGFF